MDATQLVGLGFVGHMHSEISVIGTIPYVTGFYMNSTIESSDLQYRVRNWQKRQEKHQKRKNGGTNCMKKIPGIIWLMTAQKKSESMTLSDFDVGGVDRARTYDLHDVNVAL